MLFSMLAAVKSASKIQKPDSLHSYKLSENTYLIQQILVLISSYIVDNKLRLIRIFVSA